MPPHSIAEMLFIVLLFMLMCYVIVFRDVPSERIINFGSFWFGNFPIIFCFLRSIRGLTMLRENCTIYWMWRSLMIVRWEFWGFIGVAFLRFLVRGIRLIWFIFPCVRPMVIVGMAWLSPNRAMIDCKHQLARVRTPSRGEPIIHGEGA